MSFTIIHCEEKVFYYELDLFLAAMLIFWNIIAA